MSTQSFSSESFYTPAEDISGLKAGTEKRPDLPNVLLIGDSISVGYTLPVIERLRDTANTERAKANCGDTLAGLRNLEAWLGDTRWEVIHFNWGLHDLCYRHPDARAYGHRDKINGTVSVPLDEYVRNLERLVGRLRQTGAKLIWASSTCVPEGEAGRYAGDEIVYNEAAAKVMRAHGVPVNDLHAVSQRFGAAHWSLPGDVHFSKSGSNLLADQVVAAIREVLAGLPKKF
ncbi:SGNH/GDSL hydrolase family protein [Verrucomicrobia bacterium LW23]|nr:SGNH/GDSL hydrolase family protein [Verrucomicrobia bacterium LW23]